MDTTVARQARVILRNMLQRFGYRDLEEVREEGREEGSIESLRAAVRGASGTLTREQEARLLAETGVGVLTAWVIAAARGQVWG